MHILAGVALALGRFSQRFVPSALAIAALLTGLTALMALGFTEAGPERVLMGWGDGFWSLLSFSMQMSMVMFSGYLLAVSPPMIAALRKIAGGPRSPRQAVLLMAGASMGLALLNWGLSLVGSAVLARHLAARRFADGRGADYRLLVATAYFGLGTTWHAGLSASAPLVAASASNPISAQFGVVTIDQTLFSSFNLGLVAATVLLMLTLAALLHPRPEHTLTVEPEILAQFKDFVPPAPPVERSPATFWDHAPLLPVGLGLAGLTYTALKLSGGGWTKINIDTVNLVFLSLALLAHRRPSSVLAAADEASGVLSGIVLQFPLYAGIYGIFQGTGLTDVLGAFFVKHASAESFPALIYLYSGLVNYFVPSGGAKWAIEAPYILTAAADLGVPSAKIVLAYAWGDMATDLIQPFWAVPLLAVARLDFKDILGYLLLACLAYIALVLTAFLFFL